MKKDIQIINGLLAILLIVVLLIPAISTVTAREMKVKAVITAEATDFVMLDYINSGLVNETEWDIPYTAYTSIVNESNPDTIIIEDSGNEYGYYNDVTTVNNTNFVLANYSLFTHSTKITYNVHALDIVCSDIANVDFLKLNSNIDPAEVVEVNLVFWDGVDDFTSGTFLKTGVGDWVMVIDLSVRSDLLNVPDSQVYLAFQWEFPTTTPDPAYKWKLTSNDLTSTSWMYDESIVMALSTMVSICMLGVTLAFNTDTIDIKIDRNRKDNK